MVRGGEREGACVDGGAGASKKDNGSDGLCAGGGCWGSGAGGADSKKEKSASAHESAGAWTGVFDCAIGVEFAACKGATVTSSNPGGEGIGFEASKKDKISLLPFSLALVATAATGALSGFDDPEVSISSFLPDVEREPRLAGFKRPGPMGPCSACSGINALALNSADVGEMVLFNRTIGEANIGSVGSPWTGVTTGELDVGNAGDGRVSRVVAGCGNGSSC